MAEKMRAVVKTRPALGAEMIEVPMPKLGADDVLLRVQATSICGTDVHIWKWDPWAENRIGKGKLPQTIGHEMTGEVVEVGSHVKRVKVGDLVSVETHIPCGKCIQCYSGQQHICADLVILGVDRDGTYADYIAIPERVCWVNDPSIPPEFASIQEPLGNAVYAVLGENNDVAGKSMVIVGDGPVGLMATAVARAVGVTQIFLVGLFDFNLELGRQLGADHILRGDRDEDGRRAYVRDRTDGAGADIVLEMAGAPAALADSFKYLRKGGRLSAFGVMSESTIPVDYNNGIVFRGAQVHGINGRIMWDTWLRVRNLLASGRLNLGPVITNLLPLTDFATGFEEMMKIPRTSAKIVMFPDPRELAAAQARRGHATAVGAR
jgi:threonine 3-dehydrogenase